MHARHLLATALALGLAALVSPAAGQIFTTAPQRVQGLAAAAASNGTLATAGSTSSSTEAVVLRRLPARAQGFRMAGEIDAFEWPLWITPAEAGQRLRFQIGYITSIAVMPEGSSLTLLVNDKVVARTALGAANREETIVFDIPDGVLQPGFNAVRMEASQRHRVDCSLAATYELWTQIDPAQTGLLVPRGARTLSTLADLAGVSADAQGAVPIRAVVAGRTTFAGLGQIVGAVSRTVLAGRLTEPVVDVGPLAAGDAGLNLVVGTSADIGNRLAAEIGTIEGPRAAMLPGNAERRPTLVLTGRTDEDVTAAIALLAPADPNVGSPSGLRAARALPAVRLESGTRARLRDLGVATSEFTGRLYRARFDILMPADFYAADYDRMTLGLAGGYAPGLSSDAQIVVDVNGRNGASLPLPKSNGDVFAREEIAVPLGFFRPGLNRVEIEARVGRDGDRACDPLAQMQPPKRFLLLDKTTLAVPTLARVGMLPDLAATATTGFPYVGGSRRPTLVLPVPDRASLAAAATLVAQMSVSAGTPLDFIVADTPPPPGGGPILAVAPSSSLSGDLVASAGLDRADLEAAWPTQGSGGGADPAPAPRPAVTRSEESARLRRLLQRDLPPACGFPRRQIPVAVPVAAAVDRMPTGAIRTEGPIRDLLADWDANVRGRGAVASFFFQVSDAIDGWVRSRFIDARGWMTDRFETTPARSLISPRASLVLAQGFAGKSSDDLVTIVAAPSTGELAAAVACLVDPRMIGRIAGRLSVVEPADAAVRNAPVAASRLVPTQVFSLSNWRLVAAAWFSLNSQVFAEGTLLAALLLALATHWFVKSAGRTSA